MRRFYVAADTIVDNRVTLGSDESKHLLEVLRLREGDEVRVFDGKGREMRAKIFSVKRAAADLRIIEEVPSTSPESPLDLTLAVGLLKGEKFELVVQKAVELGVTSLVPLQTARCDVRPKEMSRRIERWLKIAVEASKQCGRARLMQIAAPIEFPALLQQLPKDDRSSIMFSERGGGGIADKEGSKRIRAYFGPEGGWEDDEIELARESGVEIVTLGGRILRAETAAISVAAILQHRFGDMR